MVESRWIPIKKFMREGDLLPQELIIFIKKGLKIYSGEGVLIKYWPGSNGNEGYMYMYDPGKLPNLRGRFRTVEEFRSHSLIGCSVKIEEAVPFFQSHDENLAEILERLKQVDVEIQKSVDTQDLSLVMKQSPGQGAKEPGQGARVEEQEPTDPAPYIAWRRKQLGGIHSGQLMLEVQERWGKPPRKIMDRAEIAALVLGLDPPTGKTRESLENAFKNTTRAYKAILMK